MFVVVFAVVFQCLSLSVSVLQFQLPLQFVFVIKCVLCMRLLLWL